MDLIGEIIFKNVIFDLIDVIWLLINSEIEIEITIWSILEIPIHF